MFDWTSPSVDGQFFYFRSKENKSLQYIIRSANNDFSFVEGFVDLGKTTSPATSFFDMRQMLNGKLVLVSPTDGSLCIFSPDFNLVEKIDCTRFEQIDAELASRVSFTSFGHDPNIVLWNSGKNKFMIVDIENSQFEEISANVDEMAEVFAGLSVMSGRKVALVWKLGQLFGATYWERSSQKPLTLCKIDSRELDSESRWS